jgi:hypothetical protein
MTRRLEIIEKGQLVISQVFASSRQKSQAKQKRPFRLSKKRKRISTDFGSDWAATMENNGSMIDQVATWVGSTVSSAFFSSLERFSCVNVATSDPEDNDEDDEDYSSVTTTPTAAITPTTVNIPNPSVQNTNDVTNLPV